MAVLVIDYLRRPLMPTTEKRARILLSRRRAHVVRFYPFTIMMHDRTVEDCKFQPLQIKIDPGSKHTGICIARIKDGAVHVIALYQIEHRGQEISRKLKKRADFRRRRRSVNLRRRPARFNNRTRRTGWLPPSLQHRINTTMSWIKRFMRYAPITAIAMEHNKFDMQKMRNPGIHGQQYQRGTLYDREVMEYLLEKHNRTCAYCNKQNVPFEKDHVVPRSKGGSNRIDNLVLACRPCNLAKGAQPIEQFLAHKPALLAKIKQQLKQPLHDAAAVNATRNQLLLALQSTGLPVTTGTGAQTKLNRYQFQIPKTHTLDAACVGDMSGIECRITYTTLIKCMGRGQYQRTKPDKYGFPRLIFPRTKLIHGFQTGDLVRIHARNTGQVLYKAARIAVRTKGNFGYKSGNSAGTCSYKHMQKIQSNDGYSYSHEVRWTMHMDGIAESFIRPGSN